MLPNLVIIGAMKCATTSLHAYLGLHPQIEMSRQKELNFFAEEGNWGRGVSWYASRFPDRADVRGEASPRYTDRARHPGVASRMHAVIPDAALVYLVRDPIKRIVSHYMHEVASGHERRPFDRAVEASRDNQYVSRGLYHWQLEPYLERYSRSRILVVKQEDLRRDRARTLREVFRFVGVSPDVAMDGFEFELHQSRYKGKDNGLRRLVQSVAALPVLRALPVRMRAGIGRSILPALSRPIDVPAPGAELRRRLGEVFRDDMARLHGLTGLSFDDWCMDEG